MESNHAFLTIDKITAYQLSFDLSNQIWKVVILWESFARNSVGLQYVKAVDSISANITEGFGRYHKKDKIRFYRYSYASTQEALDWTKKAQIRGLINERNAKNIKEELEKLLPAIHHLINYTNQKLKY